MKTAKEARETTNISVAGVLSTYCEKAVEEAISQGKYSTTINLYDEPNCYSLVKTLMSALEELGYETAYYSGHQLDPCCDLTISW